MIFVNGMICKQAMRPGNSSDIHSADIDADVEMDGEIDACMDDSQDLDQYI